MRSANGDEVFNSISDKHYDGDGADAKANPQQYHE
jgi:hypothetical protein